MLLPPAVSWILTVALAAAGGCFAHRCLGPAPGVAARVSSLLHVAMCAAMLAMAWPWGTRVPAPPQVAVFAAGALWFVASAARTRRTSRALADAHHALMAAVMVWMLAAPASAHDRAGHRAMPGMGGTDGPPPGAVMFAAYFTVATLVWLAEAGAATGTGRSARHLATAAAHATMSAAAGVLTFALA